MIVFRQRSTTSMGTAFGPFGYAMPSWGEIVDTTLYVIIGAFKDKRPRLAMSDMRPSITMKDKRPAIAFTQPEAD